MVNHIKYNHNSCKKSEFCAEEMTRTYHEATEEIHLICYCSECNEILDLDISDNISYKNILRRMFVRQVIVVVPDEVDDHIRRSKTGLHDFAIEFHIELEVFGDDIVAHRELQDPWEQVVLSR